MPGIAISEDLGLAHILCTEASDGTLSRAGVADNLVEDTSEPAVYCTSHSDGGTEIVQDQRVGKRIWIARIRGFADDERRVSTGRSNTLDKAVQ